MTFGQTTLLKLECVQRGSSPERAQVPASTGQLGSGEPRLRGLDGPPERPRNPLRRCARGGPSGGFAARRPRSSGAWSEPRRSNAGPLARRSTAVWTGEVQRTESSPGQSPTGDGDWSAEVGSWDPSQCSLAERATGWGDDRVMRLPSPAGHTARQALRPAVPRVAVEI